MSNPATGKNNWISITVRLSRKSYFPGAIVSGVLTIEPSSEASQGEYVSFITIQLHGHIGVVHNLAILPPELKRDKQRTNSQLYGNVSKFVNDNTDCFYQTKPILLDGDINLIERKAYFFQLQLPNNIPPSMKTSCVRYFHLLSFCFSDKDSKPHYISIPVTVITPSSYNNESEYEFSLNQNPIETSSYYEDITEEYHNDNTITIAEEIVEPESQDTQLEFNHLYKINVNDSVMDEIWSRAKYYTSYNDYITANPSSQTSNDDSDVVYKLKHQFQIFSITHRDHIVAEIQLCTSPIVLGDVFQLVADFSNAFYSCEQMAVSLCMDEYSPYLKDRRVKSTLVMSNSMITKNVKRMPYSFSIPTVYPPSFSSKQIKIVWKLKFTFSVRSKEDPKESYVFNPELFLSQSSSKVDWTYDLHVRSCVNEHFNDVVGEKCELNGKEETFSI